MPRLVDLAGMRFGRLVVTSRTHNNSNNMTTWLCDCDCGNTAAVRADVLKRGISKSCGCLRRDQRNGKTHGMHRSRLYRIWNSMRQRCANKNHEAYKRYGGRGVSVCEEWANFSVFMEWAHSNGYSDSLTIDRIDNNGNYCPDNCQWATMKEQNNNRRDNVVIDFNGHKRTVKQWSEHLGVSYSTLLARIRRGWSDRAVLTTEIANNGVSK